MYLARAQASKRASAAVVGCPTASRSVSKLVSLGTGRLSSSFARARQVGALPTARVSGGLLPAAAHGPGKGVVEARSARLMMRDQQARSLGLFSGGGGVSHQRLKELEKVAAQSPSDANAEVCRDTSYIVLMLNCLRAAMFPPLRCRCVVIGCVDNIHTRLAVVAMCRRETSALSPLELMLLLFFRRSADNSPPTLYALVPTERSRTTA